MQIGTPNWSTAGGRDSSEEGEGRFRQSVPPEVRTQQLIAMLTNFQSGTAPLLIHGRPNRSVMDPQRMP